MTMTFRAVSLLVVGALLGGCGGGGGSSPAPPTPSTPATAPQTTPVRVALVLGGTSALSRGRRPDYISRNTKGVGVRVRPNGGAFSGTRTVPGAGNAATDVTAGSASCGASAADGSRACTIVVGAPVGYDDFEITLWDAAPVSGSFSAANALGTTSVLNSLVELNQTTPLSFTVNGVVSSVALSVSPSSLVSGTSGTTTLSVLAKDAAGNIIISPGTYNDANANPVTISVSATPACTMAAPACNSPGTTVLGQSTFTGPSVTTTTVTYNGGPLTSSVFAVSAPSLTGNNGATLSFTNTSGGLPIPGTPTITEYSSGMSAGALPIGIATGPDGNIWFTEQNGNRIGRITPSGTITEYATLPNTNSVPSGITAGPDGAMWFTENNGNRIGRITTAGVVTEFSAGISPSAGLLGITAGPDGNLWFAEFQGGIGNRIGRITPSGTVSEFATGTSGGPQTIISGPDGNLWFTENGNRIGRITTSGAVTEFSTGITASSRPFSITSGSDGNLWFTESDGNRIGRITTAGVVTEFSAGISASAFLVGITSGPDGNLWFTESAGRVGRITTAGIIAEFSSGISSGSGPYGIVNGPDGNIWFTELSASKIGKLAP